MKKLSFLALGITFVIAACAKHRPADDARRLSGIDPARVVTQIDALPDGLLAAAVDLNGGKKSKHAVSPDAWFYKDPAGKLHTLALFRVNADALAKKPLFVDFTAEYAGRAKLGMMFPVFRLYAANRAPVPDGIALGKPEFITGFKAYYMRYPIEGNRLAPGTEYLLLVMVDNTFQGQIIDEKKVAGFSGHALVATTTTVAPTTKSFGAYVATAILVDTFTQALLRDPELRLISMPFGEVTFCHPKCLR